MKRLCLIGSITIISVLPALADSPNLIENGNFEQLKDGVPIKWTTPKIPDLTEVTFPSEKNQGTVAQVEMSRSGEKGVFFSQAVKVQPNHRYRLSLLARMTQGKITVAVGGGNVEPKLDVRLIGESKAHMPMAPGFWKEDWYKNLVFAPGQWRPVTLEFDSASLTQIYVSFGAYYSEGSYAFDDVSLVEIPTPKPAN